MRLGYRIFDVTKYEVQDKIAQWSRGQEVLCCFEPLLRISEARAEEEDKHMIVHYDCLWKIKLLIDSCFAPWEEKTSKCGVQEKKGSEIDRLYTLPHS